MERHFRGNDPSGPKMLVASQQIEYTRVLEYSERPITVELWIGKLGGSSLEVHYEITAAAAAQAGSTASTASAEGERVVVAKAVSHIVIVHGETMRPIRLSEAGRASVEPWMDAPVKLRRG